MSLLNGTVHGKLIELDSEPGFPDGQKVAVTITAMAPNASKSAAMDALRRAAGAWLDDVQGLEDFLRWNRHQRKASRPEISG